MEKGPNKLHGFIMGFVQVQKSHSCYATLIPEAQSDTKKSGGNKTQVKLMRVSVKIRKIVSIKAFESI